MRNKVKNELEVQRASREEGIRWYDKASRDRGGRLKEERAKDTVQGKDIKVFDGLDRCSVGRLKGRSLL